MVDDWSGARKLVLAKLTTHGMACCYMAIICELILKSRIVGHSSATFGGSSTLKVLYE